jgi:hypothetical protein
MNVVENPEVEAVNVLSMLAPLEIGEDPMEELLAEAGEWSEDEMIEEPLKSLNCVEMKHHPDQAMHILDKQLSALKTSLSRLRFYMGDIEDLLPR